MTDSLWVTKNGKEVVQIVRTPWMKTSTLVHLAFPSDITHFQLLCVQLKLWKEKNFFLLMNICTFNLSKSLSYCGYFGFSESHWMNSFWLLVAVYKSLFPGCWYKCWCLQFWRRSGGWVIGYLELIICIFKVGGTCWNIKKRAMNALRM